MEKLDLNLNSRVEILEDKGSLFDGQLPYSLLKGNHNPLQNVFFQSGNIILTQTQYVESDLLKI